MFRTILIANRGEIACRVIRTARRMGIRTVAVFSDADQDALHVAMADEAYPIGPAPARESYLRIDRILKAAKRSGAEAIHPGYGFLSENAEFAEACAGAGVVFIGPPASAIRAMGSKSAAKSLMETAAVPLVPGYHGEDQDPALLAREAGRVGYPVLIKASAGGGGKGMRVVSDPSGFAEGLALAQGEARASFGDDRVLVERYLTRPRHIEVQVFADAHGNVAYLFERDCSIQRRHQKVVEEAPAPGLTEERRTAMGKAACDAARAIGYQGAGTVEFIAEGDAFYFMEMNTRLQVEHPVTEMMHVRVDSGVRQGDAITVHYDPMIAKLIVWDRNRAACARRLQAALLEYEVAGLQTNLDLLRRVAAHPAFLAAELDTGFLGRHPDVLTPAAAEPPLDALAAAAAYVLAERAQLARAAAQVGTDAHSPWALATAWRLNGAGYQDFTLRHDGNDHPVRAHPHVDGSFDLEAEGRRVHVDRQGDTLRLDGARHRVPVARNEDTLLVLVEGTTWTLDLIDPLLPPKTEGVGGDRITAPMPCRIVSVNTEPGAPVKRGDVLLVIEAMKVQMRLTAARDGVIAAVRAQPGELVDDGAELISLEAAA